MGRINQLAEKTTLNSTDVIAVDAGAGGNTNKMTGANLAGQLKTLGNYQGKLTFDSAPTAGSTNPVTSGGVKTALDGKQNTLTFDTTPTAGSTNPVTSGGVATAIQQSTALYCEHIQCTPAQNISAGAYGYFTVPVSYAKGKSIISTMIGVGHPGVAGGYTVTGVYNSNLNMVYVSYYSPRAISAANADFTIDIIYTDRAMSTNSHAETV